MLNTTSTNHADNALVEAGVAVEHFQHGAHALARSKDELLKEVEALIRAGEALLKSTANLSGQALVEAREQLRAKLAEVQARSADLARAARVTGRKAAAATDGYVRANPWPVIGTAAGVAFVLGAYSARR
jgi:ElaB/YqjD/DUF883 family membrane-anchored ribosome-binding protein